MHQTSATLTLHLIIHCVQMAVLCRPPISYAYSYVFEKFPKFDLDKLTVRNECRRCRPQSMSAACQLRSPVAVGPPPNAVWLLLSSAPFLALLTRCGVVY